MSERTVTRFEDTLRARKTLETDYMTVPIQPSERDALADAVATLRGLRDRSAIRDNGSKREVDAILGRLDGAA